MDVAWYVGFAMLRLSAASADHCGDLSPDFLQYRTAAHLDPAFPEATPRVRGDAFQSTCAVAFVTDLGAIATGGPATAPHRKIELRHGPLTCGAGPIAFCFFGVCACRADPSVSMAGSPRCSAVLTFCLFDVTYVTWFTQFAGMADAVEAVCVSSMLHGESFFRKPQPTYAALIWFAGVPVACCAFPTHSIGIVSIPLPDRERCLALVFCAFAASSFFEVLCP